jgi:Icc-related predicted phosphoesterase
MKTALLCCGVFGKKNGVEALRRFAAERRPDAILFSGGILDRERKVVPRSTGSFGMTKEDEHFVNDFFAVLGGLKTFSAVIPGPNFAPLDDFDRLGMVAELEFPTVHIAHITLVEHRDLAVCGLGMAIAEQSLMREDSCSRIRAQYFLRCLRTSEKPRKVLLLPEPPPGVLASGAGNGVIGEIVDGLRPSLCVVTGQTEHRGFQRIASTLIVNPGCLADGSAAWLDWNRSGEDQVEFLNG